MLITPQFSYSKPEDFSIVKVPLPTLRDDDVLVKVMVGSDGTLFACRRTNS
jgi:hypothetical protein